MVAYSFAVIFVRLLLLSCGFLVASATVSVDGDREVVVEGRIFNITSGNDTFNLECGPECKRKLFLVATCTHDDTLGFMEPSSDEDIDSWLTKMENKLSAVEQILSTGPSKEKMIKAVETLERKLLILEEKLLRIL